MDKVPSMISTKDLDYLNDMFNWHLSASKKARFYSSNIEDEEISQKLDDVYEMHKSICQKITNILEGGQNNG